MSSIDDILSFQYADESHYESDTTFNLNDVPSGKRANGDSYREFYRRLLNTNRGTHNGKWQNKEVIRKHDNAQLLDAVTSRLELTPYQREETRRAFDELELRRYRTFGVELVVYCIAAVVVARDGRNYENDSLFKQYREEAGFDTNRLTRCLNSVIDDGVA